jgi:hypothetical protein
MKNRRLSNCSMQESSLLYNYKSFLITFRILWQYLLSKLVDDEWSLWRLWMNRIERLGLLSIDPIASFSLQPCLALSPFSLLAVNCFFSLLIVRILRLPLCSSILEGLYRLRVWMLLNGDWLGGWCLDHGFKLNLHPWFSLDQWPGCTCAF